MMNDKNPTRRRMTQKWFQLGSALILALMLLLIPITAGTILRLPAPASLLSTLPADQTIELPLPFGAALIYATGGLTITKIAPELTDVGAILTYTLTISNFSSSSIKDGFGDDPLPNSVSCRSGDWLVSAPPGWNPTCDSDLNSLTWEIPSLLPGETGEIIFTVQVSDSLPDGYEIVNKNYQVVDADFDPWDEGPPVTTTIRGPMWAITKTVSSQIAEPDQILIYTITATNVGQLATEGDYTISDSVPDHTTWAAGPNPPSWTFSDPLTPGASKTVSYSVKIDSPLASGTEIVNSGYTVSGGNAFSSATNDPVATTIVSTATLQVSKVAGPDPVQVGGSLVYTITVTNEAGAAGPADKVVITDTLPSEVTYHSAGFVGPANGNIIRPDAATVVWEVTTPNPVAVGQSIQVTASVTVDGMALPDPPLITNIFEAAADNAPLVSDSINTGLSAGEPSDLTVAPASTSLQQCETTLVTATLTDDWGNPVSGIEVTLGILKGPAPEGDARYILPTVGATTDGSTDENGLFTATLQATAAGNVRVFGTGEEFGSSFTQISISGGPLPTDLALDVSPNPLAAGGFPATVTANLQDCNGNPVEYNPVTLILSPVSLATFPGPPPNTFNGDTDQEGQVSATVTSTTTQTSGTVTITGTSGDLEEAITLDILGPELTLTKSANPAHLEQINPGDPIDYTLRVTNTGSIEVTGVRLTDTLPSLVNYVSLDKSTTGSGQVSGPTFPGGNQIVLTLDQLEPGKILQSTISVTVTATLSGTLLDNRAQVRSDQTALINSNTVAHTVITETVSTGHKVYLPTVIKEQ